MNTAEKLELLADMAVSDKGIRERFLFSRNEEKPLRAFSDLAREYGIDISPIDIVEAGEDFHAAMKRSTNGGGENSPMLVSQDDFYEQYFVMLEMEEKNGSRD